MKKHTLIIPIVLITLALLAGTLMTFAIAPGDYAAKMGKVEIVYEQNQYVTHNDYAYKVFDSSVKDAVKYELAYELYPSISNGYVLCDIYSPVRYIIAERTGETLPDDFIEKCIKYNCLFAEQLKKDDIKRSEQLDYGVSTWQGTVDLSRFRYDAMYAFSLYLHGDSKKALEITDESLAYCELSDSIKTLSLPYAYMYFLPYVYNYAENDAQKEWAVNAETTIVRITCLYNENEQRIEQDRKSLFPNENLDEKLGERYK